MTHKAHPNPQSKGIGSNILWSVSLFGRVLEAVREVKWLLTLSTDLCIKCLFAISEREFSFSCFDSLRRVSSLHEQRNFVLFYTSSCGVSSCTGMFQFLPRESCQAVRNTSFYFIVHFYFPSDNCLLLSLSQMQKCPATLLFPPVAAKLPLHHVIFFMQFFLYYLL